MQGPGCDRGLERAANAATPLQRARAILEAEPAHPGRRIEADFLIAQDLCEVPQLRGESRPLARAARYERSPRPEGYRRLWRSRGRVVDHREGAGHGAIANTGIQERSPRAFESRRRHGRRELHP